MMNDYATCECKSCLGVIIPPQCEACVVRLREDVVRLREERNDYVRAVHELGVEAERLRKLLCPYCLCRADHRNGCQCWNDE